MSLILVCSCALSEAEDGANGDGGGFAALFNGEDLSGWEGDERLWSVKDGVIVGSTREHKIKRNTFLSTNETFANFALRIKVRLENGNSGIQFRSERHPDHVVKGYQADVAEKVYMGMLYEEGKRGIMPYWNELSQDERDAIFNSGKQKEWNQYEITCKGDHLLMVLNGKTVLDLDDPAGAKTGVIALQLHVGPGMIVEYKDIEIKKLP